LADYYLTEGSGDKIVINLPKGRYVTEFVLREELENGSMPNPFVTNEIAVTAPRRRPLLGWRSVAIAISALVVILVASFLLTELKPASTPSEAIIVVWATASHDDQNIEITKLIDSRLAPALAEIGLARIISRTDTQSLDSIKQPWWPLADNDRNAFILNSSVDLEEGRPVLFWRLVEARTGALLWASNETLDDSSPQSAQTAVNSLSFKLLGTEGALKFVLERLKDDLLTGANCLSQAQKFQAILAGTIHAELQRCLEEIVAARPNHATAWAILSAFYTLRSENEGYMLRSGNEGTEGLLAKAAQAAARAQALAPNTYFTDIALMNLAFQEGDIATFDRLRESMLKKYSGDPYLKLRIGNRLVRLGRNEAGAKLVEEALKAMSVTTGDDYGAVVLAYYNMGDYQKALSYMARMAPPGAIEVPSTLLLKVMIYGELGDTEEAGKALHRVLEIAPDIGKNYYRIYRAFHPSEDVLQHAVEGLRKAGLVVEDH
jgi:tetratricopeptide (TPR) repeat protein/TolB-like protein